VEFAAVDHGKQNYSPLIRPLYLRGRTGGDGVAADLSIKHNPDRLRKCLMSTGFS
jgi:hypothetical protein